MKPNSALSPVLNTMLLFGLIAETQGDVLDNWTTNQVTTNSFAFGHVVYGNGRYVVVGQESDSGAAYSSEDGFNWTLRFSDLSSWGLSLNYSSGHFAGVGGWGSVVVSTNGIDWSSSFLPSSYYDPNGNDPLGQAITYGNSVYITVGDTNGVGNILSSPDGINWSPRRVLGLGPGGRISDVAYGASRFVAIGNNDCLVYTSATGAFAGGMWTSHAIPGGNKIGYGNGLFIVPLNNETNLLSADGTNWDLQITGLTNRLQKVTFANGLFMAQCGTNPYACAPNYFATSADGTNWTQYTKGLPNGGYLDVSVATDGTRMVAVSAERTNSSLTANALVYISDVLVQIGIGPTQAGSVVLSGLVGRKYQIQSTDILSPGSNYWRTNVTLQLPMTPYVWTDTSATNSQRFYRAVLLP